MNAQINSLDYSDVLFLDIETVRAHREVPSYGTEMALWRRKMRDKETDERPSPESAQNLYRKRAALYPVYSKVVTIVLGFVTDDGVKMKRLSGEEKDILKEFVSIVGKSGRKLCGFNIIKFDLPFIRKRCSKYDIEYLSEKQGNDVGSKPWILAESVIDLMDLFKGTSYLSNSLDELAFHHNIPSSKGKMDGSEVGDYYYDGKLEEIIEYCERDVLVCVNILRKWKGDDSLEVAYGDINELPLMKQIMKRGTVTDEDMEKINSLKLTKKDKENVDKILLALIEK